MSIPPPNFECLGIKKDSSDKESETAAEDHDDRPSLESLLENNMEIEEICSNWFPPRELFEGLCKIENAQKSEKDVSAKEDRPSLQSLLEKNTEIIDIYLAGFTVREMFNAGVHLDAIWYYHEKVLYMMKKEKQEWSKMKLYKSDVLVCEIIDTVLEIEEEQLEKDIISHREMFKSMDSLQTSMYTYYHGCQTKDIRKIKFLYARCLEALQYIEKMPDLEQLMTRGVNDRNLELRGKMPNLRVYTNLESTIEELPHFLFELEKLEVIQNRFGMLACIDPRVSLLKNLKVLDFEYNMLWYVPPVLNQLVNLEVLVLAGNEFKDIPEPVLHMSHLQVLDMSHNQLKTIPPEIGNLVEMRSLFLSDNKIEKIPPEIKHLKKLMCLNMKNNQLTITPPELQECPALENVHLQENQLTTYPLVFNCKQLYLDNNNISIPMPMAHKYIKLETLTLIKNPLRCLFRYKYPPLLKTIDVSDIHSDATGFTSSYEDNRIQQIVCHNIKNLTRYFSLNHFSYLKIIDISFNRFQQLDLKEFRELKYLEHLYAGNNNIQEIKSTLNHCKSLKGLHLQNNFITKIEEGFCAEKHGIEQLIFAYNPNLPTDFLKDINQLENLVVLDLNETNLKECPKALNKNLKLNCLRMNNALFNELDPDIPFEQLKIVSLQGLHLTTLPEAFMKVEAKAYPKIIDTYPCPEMEKQHKQNLQAMQHELEKGREKLKRKPSTLYAYQRKVGDKCMYNYGLYKRRWPKYTQEESLYSRTDNEIRAKYKIIKQI